VSSSQWGCATSCAPSLTPRMIYTPRWIDETSTHSYPPMTDISVTHSPVTYSARLGSGGPPGAGGPTIEVINSGTRVRGAPIGGLRLAAQHHGSRPLSSHGDAVTGRFHAAQRRPANRCTTHTPLSDSHRPKGRGVERRDPSVSADVLLNECGQPVLMPVIAPRGPCGFVHSAAARSVRRCR
jgi:hypothetical protein